MRQSRHCTIKEESENNLINIYLLIYELLKYIGLTPMDLIEHNPSITQLLTNTPI